MNYKVETKVVWRTGNDVFGDDFDVNNSYSHQLRVCNHMVSSLLAPFLRQKP